MAYCVAGNWYIQGELGVGTDNPGRRLGVVSPDNSTTSFVGFYPANLSQGVEFWYGGIRMGGSNPSVAMSLETKGAESISLRTNSSTRMYINSGGDIGIGTTATAGKLTIAPPSSTTASTVNYTSTDNAVISSYYNQVYIVNNSYTQAGRQFVVAAGGTGYGNTCKQLFTVDADSESVGINTTCATSRLTVSRPTEQQKYQIEVRNEGGITDGNYDGIAFTQASTGTTPLGSIRLKYASNGYPSFGIYTREGSTTETEKFTISNPGNIGVGETSPAGKLHITHLGAQGACAIIIQSSNTNGNGAISWRSCAGTTQSQIGSNYNVGDANGNLEFITSGNTRLLVTSGGNVGINSSNPTYKLHIGGTFYAAGSSIEYKKDIKDYESVTSKFMNLRPVSYVYKDEWQHLGRDLKSQNQIGLIAEEVAEVLPELAILVEEDGKKVIRNVDYEKLSIILLSEVQKLRKQVDSLIEKS